MGLFAILLVIAAACGAGGDAHASAPKTVNDLESWLKDAGECEAVETSTARLPIPAVQVEEVPSGLERFDQQANFAALIGCGGVNGFISYFRFPTAEARAAATEERDGLIAHELFCAKGTELVINELLGYDDTIGFCERLGFAIHRPTQVETPAIKHLQKLLEEATRISAHRHHLPPSNIYCEQLRGKPLEFSCEAFQGGGSEIIKLGG